jgi:hypothetical protein
VWHVVGLGIVRKLYKISLVNLKGWRLRMVPSCKRYDNIEIDLKNLSTCGLDYSVQDTDHC